MTGTTICEFGVLKDGITDFSVNFSEHGDNYICSVKIQNVVWWCSKKLMSAINATNLYTI